MRLVNVWLKITKTKLNGGYIDLKSIKIDPPKNGTIHEKKNQWLQFLSELLENLIKCCPEPSQQLISLWATFEGCCGHWIFFHKPISSKITQKWPNDFWDNFVYFQIMYMGVINTYYPWYVKIYFNIAKNHKKCPQNGQKWPKMAPKWQNRD